MADTPDDWEDGELDEDALVVDDNAAEVEKAVFGPKRELMAQLGIDADELAIELDSDPAAFRTAPLLPMGLPTSGRSAMGISGTPTTAGTNGVALTSWTALSTGGNGPYTFTIASGGPLPTGVTLGATTGTTSGTPSQTGTFSNIVVRVTDVYGQIADLAPYTLVIS